MLLLCYIKNVTLQISGGAAVSAAPTKQILGVHLSPLGFAACQSKKCTNVLYDVVVLTYVTLLIISP